jgi:acyl-CoA dehydrogenase
MHRLSPTVHDTPERTLLRDQVERFVAREIEPFAGAWEREGRTPKELLARMGDAGLLGLVYGAEHGGAEADALTNLAFAESLSTACSHHGVVVTVLVHTDMASPHLHHAGTAAQKARWLPGVVAGTTLTAVAITEPGAGSDVAGIRTRAVRSVDGAHWILNGSKLFITNGTQADLVFVAAKTGEGRHAMSIFAVPAGTPGFRVGRALEKSGWLSSDTAELVFEDCRIPADHLLGEEGKGFYAVMQNFQTERIALGAMAVGLCRQAIDATLEHVRDRQAFGGTLWDKQVVRQAIAGLDAKTRAARAFLHDCAWRVTQGQDVVQEVSMLKALTGELAVEVTTGCQQLWGGSGYIRGTPVERMWRDARILAIGGGATEVMLDEVAKRY